MLDPALRKEAEPNRPAAVNLRNLVPVNLPTTNNDLDALTGASPGASSLSPRLSPGCLQVVFRLVSQRLVH